MFVVTNFLPVKLAFVPVGNSSVVFGVGFTGYSSSTFSGLYGDCCGALFFAASAAAVAFFISAACSVSYLASFRLLTMHTVIAIVTASTTITTQTIMIRSQFSWIHIVVPSVSSFNGVLSWLVLFV